MIENIQYSKKVMNRFKHLKHSGEIKNYDGVGKVGNPQCGDILWVYIKVGKNKKGKEFIKDIKYKTLGCVAALAFSEELARLAKGKTLKKAKMITNQRLIKSLGKVPKIKFHCSLLAEQALKNAIKDYEKKK